MKSRLNKLIFNISFWKVFIMKRQDLKEQAMLSYCKTIILEYIRMYDQTSVIDTKHYTLGYGFTDKEYDMALNMLLIHSIEVDLSCVPANLVLLKVDC